MIREPISVYCNWASYDELSDNVELTEALATRQLDELIRLRRLGVRLDYYLMDCFWYAPDGGYRTWRRPHWPDGPDAWLARCWEHGVKPGLWVATNNVVSPSKLDVIPEWKGSFDESCNAMCWFAGGYLDHFFETLDYWYVRGVRLYKFDFANFAAAPTALRETMLPSEIRAANISAFSGAMKAFRRTHPEVVMLAYNGFEEMNTQGRTDIPLRKSVDTRWLEAFDAMYCGDPRPADVPAMRFWRSKDVYSDHMVWRYVQNGIPFARIDNSGFMIGTTGTCYHRKTAAWKGMLLLGLARGGFANTYYGNLELIDDADARWFARVQDLILPLQPQSRMIGGVPGRGEPYAFLLADRTSGIYVCVNPSQTVARLILDGATDGRIVFADAGFEPTLDGTTLTLGPEQLVVVGTGDHTLLDLGRQTDVVIPRRIARLEARCTSGEGRSIVVEPSALPSSGRLRIVVRQTDAKGAALRSTGGSPPHGRTLGRILEIRAHDGEREVPVAIEYDKAIWSGLSWAAGEIDLPVSALRVTCTTAESGAVLYAELHHVEY